MDPRILLTSIGVVIYDWDLSTDRIAWGGNAADVLGAPDIGCWSTGQAFAAIADPVRIVAPRDGVPRPDLAKAGTGTPYCLRYSLRTKPTQPVMVEDSGRWYVDAEGRPALAHGMIRVLSPSEEMQEPSGAQQRQVFLTRLAEEVVAASRCKGRMSIVVAAVDNLAALNDTLGFDRADAMLDEVFRRLRRTMRRRDAFARYSGNRFALALRSCPIDQIRTAVDRLTDLVTREPISLDGRDIRPRLLFGAASAPGHASDAPALLRCAEQALAQSKRYPAVPLVVYDPAPARDERRAKPRPAIDVVELLNERRIAIACQPVVDAQTRKPAFHEALLRIRDPDGKLTTAGDVIPIVERTGLIPLVDIRVLELSTLHLARTPEARLSVNVSPATLDSPDWLPALAANIGTHQGVASRLILEVTETVAISDPERTRRRLDAMKSLGVAIAIDDFGAGHTSFKHLRGFPFDLVKIDGAFVQNLSRSNDDRFFVRTLVDLAHHLGLPIVSEWVEDEATAALLASWGVDYLQGDHCGRPVLIETEHPPVGPDWAGAPETRTRWRVG